MDEPYAEWYKSLKVPDHPNMPCCNQGGSYNPEDCKNVDTRQVRDDDGTIHWEAFASSKLFKEGAVSYGGLSPYGHAPDAWVRVPDEAILPGEHNPTGQAVGCWYGGRWLCFLRGTDT
jgi:hypothetical protein